MALIRGDNKVTREEMAKKIGVSKKTVEREIRKISRLSNDDPVLPLPFFFFGFTDTELTGHSSF